MALVCGGCKQVIEKGAIVKALDKDWHPNCFVCTQCRGPIEGGSFTVDEKDMPYCGKCASSAGAGGGDSEPCRICGQKLGAQRMQGLNGGFTHPECFRCKKCNRQIQADENFVRRGNDPFHTSCVMDTQGNTLKGTMTAEETCPTCGKELSGSCVTAEGKTYHRDCFTCAACNGQLRGGYMISQGQPMCTPCAEANRPPQKSKDQMIAEGVGASNLARAEMRKANRGMGQWAGTYDEPEEKPKPAPAKPAASSGGGGAASKASKPRFCGECGTKSSDARFCGECGFKFY